MISLKETIVIIKKASPNAVFMVEDAKGVTAKGTYNKKVYVYSNGIKVGRINVVKGESLGYHSYKD